MAFSPAGERTGRVGRRLVGGEPDRLDQHRVEGMGFHPCSGVFINHRMSDLKGDLESLLSSPLMHPGKCPLHPHGSHCMLATDPGTQLASRSSQ